MYPAPLLHDFLGKKDIPAIAPQQAQAPDNSVIFMISAASLALSTIAWGLFAKAMIERSG
jgi:hypothetical protein